MEKKIVKVLWGDDHYEDTLEETIHYLTTPLAKAKGILSTRLD